MRGRSYLLVRIMVHSGVRNDGRVMMVLTMMRLS